jgi:hypothetical protein
MHAFVCRRKQLEVQNMLDSLGLDEVDERLSAATSMPATPSYRFASLLQVVAANHDVWLVKCCNSIRLSVWLVDIQLLLLCN